MSDDRIDEVMGTQARADEPVDRDALSQLVRALAHDLNSPLGSVTMDVYSLGECLEALGEALDRGDAQAARRELDELRDVRENLDDASRRAVDLVRELRRLGHALQGED